MKTQTETRKVTTSTAESREFTIQANGKAFRILIDGLYENKVQSIVREIWSNALDSHAAAGYPERPFDVIFPSVFEPTFAVRDYGTSLSHDEIMGLYSTVFQSTKEDTNVAVGKFGLGSKSPFAYTDSFSVSAVSDGKKRLYSAVIAEDGVPMIHFMGEVDTDEERGIEVSFPIATRDVDSFRKAMYRVSHGFDVKPNVIRKEDDHFDEWPELPILSEGDGWKLLRGTIEGYSERAYAKMGCVLYPINIDAITELAQGERELLRSTMIIDFPVGDLEINASREALSYGPKDPTVASIRNRIRTIVAEMTQSFMDQYAEANTYWDACVLFSTHLSSSNMPTAVRKILINNAKFKGEKLSTYIQLTNQPKSASSKSSVFVSYRSRLSFTVMSHSDLTKQTYRFDYSCDRANVQASETTCIIIEDMDERPKQKRVPGRIKHLVRNVPEGEERIDQVLWIKYHGGSTESTELLSILDAMDGARLITADELPELPKDAVTGTYRRPVAVRVLDRSEGRFELDHSLDAEDLEDGGFYVPLERNQPLKPGKASRPNELWESMIKCGLVDPSKDELYGAPKSLWHLFEDDNWINIYDYAKEHIEKTDPKVQILKAMCIEEIRRNSELRFLKDSAKHFTELAKDSPISKAVEFFLQAMKADKPAVEGIRDLYVDMGFREILYQEAEGPEIVQLKQILADVTERYPLLFAFDSWYMREYVDKLSDYVQMCDKAAAHDSLSQQPATNVA